MALPSIQLDRRNMAFHYKQINVTRQLLFLGNIGQIQSQNIQHTNAYNKLEMKYKVQHVTNY